VSHALLKSEIHYTVPQPVEFWAEEIPSGPSSSSSGPSANAHTGGFPEAAGILNDVRRAMEGNHPEGARAAALRLLTVLTEPVDSELVVNRGGLAPWQKRKLDLYLNEHIEDRVRLDDLAELVSLSISHFCRAFKETCGITPHTYIMRLRLELAQKLMLTTRDPLSQIALACGLADLAHLSKLFRRELGQTPSAWRRLHFTGAQADVMVPYLSARDSSKDARATRTDREAGLTGC
jgi:AraC family transcriptional regulator